MNRKGYYNRDRECRKRPRRIEASFGHHFRDQPEHADGRKQHEDELDERVADWTASLSVMSVVEALQPAVAAGPVHNQSALYDDPQISHLGYFEVLEHPVIGEVPYNGMQARLSATPAHLRKAAPCVGEDSYYVLSELLDLDADEIADLLAAEVIEIT